MSAGVKQWIVRIPGQPRTQGSATLHNSRMLKTQQEKAHRHMAEWVMRREWKSVRLECPVRVDIRAEFERAESHYRTGRFAAELKPSAPGRHTYKPDADKIARLLLDALKEAGVIKDDSQVCELRVEKRWIPRGEESGTTVTLTAVDILTVKDTHHDE